MGEVSLDRLCRELVDMLWPPLVGNGDIHALGGFDQVVIDFIRRTIFDPRRSALVLGRLAPTEERAQSLQQLGQTHGLSRERARQIIDEALARLRKPVKLALLKPLWAEVWPILQSWQRPISLDRLGPAICRRLEWNKLPLRGAMARLFDLQPELNVAEGMISLKAANAATPPSTDDDA